MVGGGLFNLDDHFLTMHDRFMQEGYGFFLDAVFGGQPCLWHSGRVIRNPIPADKLEEEMHLLLDEYTKRGISCRLNFSAPDVDVSMLGDKKSNLMLRILAEHNTCRENPHGVIVASDPLREYVRDRYPDLFITASVIKTAYAHPSGSDTPEWYDDLASRFDMVVVRSDRNLSLSFLNAIEHKEKMELILNSECVLNCPMRVPHYQYMQDIGRGIVSSIPKFNALMEKCRERKGELPNIALTQTQVDRIFDLGFRHFKLAGREMSWQNWRETNARFLVDESLLLDSMLDQAPSSGVKRGSGQGSVPPVL